MSIEPTNDLEKLLSDRLIALLHDSGNLPGVQKIHPESKVDVRTPLIQVQVETAGPAPGFEGSGMASGVFTVVGMVTVVVDREEAQEGLLLKLTGIVRDLLLGELRDDLQTLNYEHPDGRQLKVWHMEVNPSARSTDSEQGVDHRTFNLTFHAAVIEPEPEEE